MRISEKGLDIIKRSEGCKLEAYLCPVGKWTIGWGHTRGVKEGMTITQAIADQLLKDDMAEYEDAVNKMGVHLRQNEFDALVCLVYNIGPGKFGSSTIRKKVIEKARKDNEIVAEFKKWNKGTVKGKLVELAGLTKRRAEEAALWLL